MSGDDFIDRTTCERCSEELWTEAERFGLCIGCQRREEGESDDDYRDEDYDD